MYTALFSLLFLIVGFMIGWLGSERYTTYMEFNKHEFDELFKQNPHPELFDKDGKLNRGEYMFVDFELGYDPNEVWEEDTMDD